MIAASLDDLHAQLQAMQDPALAEDMDALQLMLIRHDRDMRQFLHSEAGRQADYEQLAALLGRQLAVQQQFTAARDEAGRQLSLLRQSGNAVRAYANLSGSDA